MHDISSNFALKGQHDNKPNSNILDNWGSGNSFSGDKNLLC